MSKRTKGQARPVPANEKTNGILAVLSKLKEDKNNSLSLNTAVGIERRNFLLKAVMPELQGLKLRIDSAKFKALQDLMFSHPGQKRRTLELAASRHYCFPKHHGGGFMSSPPPRKNVFDVFENVPPMPWKERKQAEILQKTESAREEELKKLASRFEHIGAADRQRESKALPTVKHFPPTQITHSSAHHRAIYSSGPREAEQEELLELERKNRACLFSAKPKVPVRKYNVGVNTPATERALRRLEMRQFFSEFLSTSAEEKFYKAKYESGKSVFLAGSIQSQVRKQDREHRQRVHGVFERLGCSPPPRRRYEDPG